MISRFFWLFATVLLALVVHISFVLFSPRMDMGEIMRRMSDSGVNGFRLLKGGELAMLTRRPLKHMLYGACMIDLGRGGVELAASIPETYWAITVYSPDGAVVYTLNDRHADVDKLAIIFRYGENTEGELGTPRLREGKLQVPLGTRRALVVVEAYVKHPGMRQRITRALKASTCRRATSVADTFPPD